MTVQDAFFEYIEFLRSQRRDEKTIKTKLNFHFKDFILMYGNLPIKELTIDHLRGFLSMIRNRNYAHKTYASFCYDLRAFAKWLALEEIATIKYHRLAIPKSREAIIECLTEEELEKLLGYFKNKTSTIAGFRDLCVYFCLFDTGCRISELLSLNRDSIDFQWKSVQVIGKGYKVRSVYLKNHSAMLLKKYLSMRKDCNPALFVSHSNRDYQCRISRYTVQKNLKLAATSVGIYKNVTPHKLRHTFATSLLNNGLDVHALMRLLGHSSLRTTQTYIHVADKMLRMNYQKYHYEPKLTASSQL